MGAFVPKNICTPPLSPIIEVGREMELGMLRVILAIGLAWLLTACSGAGTELRAELVEQAIAWQLSQTQQELSQQLRLPVTPDGIRVSHVKVTQQTPLKIQNLPSYQVRGTCDFTIKRPKHTLTQRQVPFEVYLQRQTAEKTWRAAYPKVNEAGEPTWLTQPLDS